MPEIFHPPLQVQAPEVIFNNLLEVLRVEFGTRTYVLSAGCLVRFCRINTKAYG